MILIVDDDPSIRSSLSLLMKVSGKEARCAATPEAALTAVRECEPDVVLLDMNFTAGNTTGRDGIELLQRLRILAPKSSVILMTAWGSIDLAVEGMRTGAFDFVTKPWDNRALMARIDTALKINGERHSDVRFDRGGIIGHDPGLESVLNTVAKVSATDAPVLIMGESGTGKELIAEAVHRNSLRASGPFVKVNLGGMPQSLFESEMFGYRKGAFTGAVSDRVGRFEAADGGTIFLDEIGELDLASQVKMLRVLQEQCFEPLGSSETRRVDVRVICATNVDLGAMVSEQRFREDLLYRINLVSVTLPPLRSRDRSDIVLLAESFLADCCRRYRRSDTGLSPDAAAYLKSLPYPGNIRELKNLVERTFLLTDNHSLGADDFKRMNEISGKSTSGTSLKLEDIEKQRITDALDRHKGNISQAARELGVSRAALYRRIEKFGL